MQSIPPTSLPTRGAWPNIQIPHLCHTLEMRLCMSLTWCAGMPLRRVMRLGMLACRGGGGGAGGGG